MPASGIRYHPISYSRANKLAERTLDSYRSPRHRVRNTHTRAHLPTCRIRQSCLQSEMASRGRILIPSPAHRPVGRARPSIRLSINRRAAIQHYKSPDDPANYGRLVSHLCNNAESQKLHEVLPVQYWHEFRCRQFPSKYA